MRIRARAIRRCGELLKQFEAPGARSDLGRATTQGNARKQSDATDTLISQISIPRATTVSKRSVTPRDKPACRLIKQSKPFALPTFQSRTFALNLISPDDSP